MYPSKSSWDSKVLAWHGDRFPIKHDSPRFYNERLEGEIIKSIISSTRSCGEKCDDEKFDSSNISIPPFFSCGLTSNKYDNIRGKKCQHKAKPTLISKVGLRFLITIQDKNGIVHEQS